MLLPFFQIPRNPDSNVPDMSTPANDVANINNLAPGHTYYWCTFSDKARTKIASLTSILISQPPGAELLPETDERVQYLINPPEGRSVHRLQLTSLDDLYRIAHQFDTGIPKPLYRGQSDYSWKLQTRLERNIPQVVLHETGLETYEYRVLAESQRRLHHFIDQLPDEDDHLSWLALLRHHAVPTRLLDVTRSLFVACYFALRDAKPGADAAVWIFSRQAIDNAFVDWSHRADDTWLRPSPFTVFQCGEPYYTPQPKKRQVHTDPPTIASLRHPVHTSWLDFSATLDAALRGFVERPGVAVAEPFWVSRRMDVQQGAFLAPFNVRMSFEENLSSFLQLSTDEIEEQPVPHAYEELFRLWAHSRVIKLRIPASLHAILRVKLEAMNIRDLTLFPDAEGALAHLTSLIPTDGR